jgi:ATP-dependent Clp protease ATP-binding subunit ClpA
MGLMTERARRVMAAARDEALRRQHDYIGTEHLLIAIAVDAENLGAKVLVRMGVQPDTIVNAVNSILRNGPQPVTTPIGLTPRAKHSVEFAMDAAGRMFHSWIGCEHLLLGLVAESESISAGILAKLGVTVEGTRENVRAVVAERGAMATTTRGQNQMTEGARRVMAAAQEEALKRQHNYIGTEHLLIAIAADADNAGNKTLRRMDIDPAAVIEVVNQAILAAPRPAAAPIGMTPRAKHVMKLAAGEAELLEHSWLGCEHLLLGLVSQTESISAGVLQKFGVTIEAARENVLALIKELKAQG